MAPTGPPKEVEYVYVTHPDHVNLERENTRLRAEVARLRKKLRTRFKHAKK